MSSDGEDNTIEESHALGNLEDLKEPQTKKLKKKLLIQFGSFSKPMKVNVAFMLPKTFKAKEGEYLAEDEKNEGSQANDQEVIYPYIFYLVSVIKFMHLKLHLRR